MKNILYYDKPALCWEHGMPFGNGRLGAMVLGGCETERITLNEDTLWSGYPLDYNDPGVYSCLQEARELIFAKEYKKAEELINRHMVGSWNESYLPMADLVISIPGKEGRSTGYDRKLNLQSGIGSIKFKLDGVNYKREIFCSYPDQVLAVRLEADLPVDMEAVLSSQLRHSFEREEDTLYLSGWCPEIVEPDYYPAENPIIYKDEKETKAIHFRTGVKAVLKDGSFIIEKNRIRITNCREVVFLISSANSFAGYASLPDREYREELKDCLKRAGEKGYEELLKSHRKDYEALFSRVELELGHTENEELPVAERLDRLQRGEKDPEMIATAFQYGRYLMIASSRPGTQPINLQGIWNDKLRAPWSSNYTVNINAEMNYWPAESCNLSECAEPLMKFIEECAEAGAKTAAVNYRCRGWCVHHNVDLWRKTTAVGSRNKEINVLPWSFWLAGGGWLCRHLWEHYLYTQDKEFLCRTALPLMQKCAEFYLDWMVERDGQLLTCPSTSPENMFIDRGIATGVSYAVTLDNTVIRELFQNCLKAYKEFGEGEVFEKDGIITEIENALKKLPKLKTGRHGQLQEWIEDYEENEVTHRHLSLLYGLYPSDLITEKDSELMKACAVTLKRRGNDGVPWSRAWKINLFARLKDKEEAAEEVLRYLQPAFSEECREISYTNGGIYENLFAARPLQIDGCFGFTAGIAEMLVQDHKGALEVLPAIPKEWEKGYVRGLKLRNGKSIEIKWEPGQVSYEVYDHEG